MHYAMQFDVETHQFGVHLLWNERTPAGWTLYVYFSIEQAAALLREIAEGREELAAMAEELPKTSPRPHIRLIGAKVGAIGTMLFELYQRQPNFAMHGEARVIGRAFPAVAGESAFLSWVDERLVDNLLLIRSIGEGKEVIRSFSWVAYRAQDKLLGELMASALPRFAETADPPVHITGGFAEILNKAILYRHNQIASRSPR